jgi:uncharacterized phage protein gp47/JayE
MAFTRPTLAEIYARIVADMESRLTGNVTILRRALLRVLAAVFAGAVHILYGYLTFIAEQLFPDTALREWLERHGFIWGVDRKAAAFAIGTFTFSGVNATVIPAGTAVARDSDGIEYTTDALGTIAGGVANIAATASEAGVAGNMTDPTDVSLVEPIAGITGVVLNGDFADGADEETDEDYRARILFRIQEPPAGGTAADFIRWAEEVSGVDKAWSFPITPSAGAVTVAYLGTAAAATVEAHIETLMPVTTDLFIVKLTGSAYIVPFDIYIQLDPNTAEQQAAIVANLEAHIASVAAPGENLLWSQIENAVSTAGPDNFRIYQLSAPPPTQDGLTGDILFSGFDYGELGTVFFTSY